MIVDDLDRHKYFLSYNEKYNEENICQMKFDFESTYVSSLYSINSEYRSIYKNKDGKLIIRITNNIPNTSYGGRAYVGYVNGYGHQLVDYYQQYKFNI